MNPDVLAKYLKAFSELSRKVSKEHGQAPHKPLLLLAVLDEVQRGAYPDGLITITPELVAAFRSYFDALVAPGYWLPRMENPFRYLYQDGFWNFIANGVVVAPENRTYTLNQLSTDFDGVRLAPDLSLIAVSALRKQLLDVCFQKIETDVQKVAVAEILNYEVEKLKAEAQSKFRIKKVKESNDDGYFVRHALFPRVIKSLYKDQCCVCRLATHVKDKTGIVDAAHILPFAEFHYDDPRNGLALCKNHHFGFDHGWFGITETYKVAVSPQLQRAVGYIESGTEILLPENALYNPEPAALQWHQDNKLLR